MEEVIFIIILLSLSVFIHEVGREDVKGFYFMKIYIISQLLLDIEISEKWSFPEDQ
ncbi:hypothetical protein [Lysinibacillus sphaericus]|uniref:hypothetical protein n=1 Tax=Lysinibacillus sphaericus TaxID=1421 RepID=UPI0019D6873B|nr:hypothetical protein [Lysinibacillus sphaericus]